MIGFRTPFDARHWLRLEIARQIVLFAVPIGMAAAVVIFVFYHLDVQMADQHLGQTEAHHLDLRQAMIRENLRSTVTGLKGLAAAGLQAGPGNGGAGFAGPLSERFAAFCGQFTHFLRIRRVSRHGDGNLAVVCRSGGGNPEPLASGTPGAGPVSDIALPASTPGSIRVSGFHSLRGVGGQSTPGPPLVQVALTLQPPPGGEPGFLVIDVDLRHFVSDVMLDTGQGGTMILVDAQGHFVRKPAGKEKWGDTLRPGTGWLLETLNPELWQALRESQHGVVETREGLFTFGTVDLAQALESESEGAAGGASVEAPTWKIVSHVPHADLSAGRRAFLLKIWLLIPAPLLVTLYLANIAVRRKRTARELEENEKYLRGIMDSVVDGIITTDRAGRIERANEATVVLFGLSPGQEAPRDILALLPLDTLPPETELVKFWQGGRAERRPVRAEITAQRPDGTEFPAEVVVMEVVLGGETRFIWVIRDVSERHAFEAKQDAERMRFFHQTKMAEIGLIAAGIIHEVGNPIAALSGLITHVAKENEQEGSELGTKTREHLKLIAQQTERLAGITREISDFVRTRPGVTELFDLNSLLRSTSRLVQFDVRWKEIGLKLELDPGIPAILGVPDQIAQVLMNLLVNAADAVQEKPPGERQISVTTEYRGQKVGLTVGDNGLGMGDAAKRQAFESFYTTKPEGKGTGLGLSLCRTIVTAHKGTIEIESEEGEGTSVRVSLPAPVQAEHLTG